ncbi:hypothetical protein OC861_004055 [Tilletia horrida]|nr:hypothetical protein OC861_004055 [Tilletia horrida]
MPGRGLQCWCLWSCDHDDDYHDGDQHKLEHERERIEYLCQHKHLDEYAFHLLKLLHHDEHNINFYRFHQHDTSTSTSVTTTTLPATKTTTTSTTKTTSKPITTTTTTAKLLPSGAVCTANAGCQSKYCRTKLLSNGTRATTGTCDVPKPSGAACYQAASCTSLKCSIAKGATSGTCL